MVIDEHLETTVKAHDQLLHRRVDLLLRTGKLLVESLADTNRIVRNMKRTAAYLGIPEEKLHINVSFTMLMVNVSDGDYSFTKFQRIEGHGVNMTAISEVSKLSWRAIENDYTLDQYEEERLGGKSFGSTKSGIAPFYSDKYAKIGFQVSELFDEEHLKEKLASVCATKNVLLEHLYHKPLLNVDELFAELMEYKKMVEPYVCDVSLYLWNALKEGKEVLLEGQLGSLKDPDHGIYPMVTSSSTLAGYGAVGAGLPPYEIKQIVTVCKAYSSAVGAGAFVSEIFGDEADELRRRGGDGGEFGATTGRPRRMGWFDCVASKYGCRLQGATDVAFTVLDVLGYLDEIPVCTGYEIDGKVTTEFATSAESKNMKICRRTAESMLSSLRNISDSRSL